MSEDPRKDGGRVETPYDAPGRFPCLRLISEEENMPVIGHSDLPGRGNSVILAFTVKEGDPPYWKQIVRDNWIPRLLRPSVFFTLAALRKADEDGVMQRPGKYILVRRFFRHDLYYMGDEITE
jgi:hypothetical protein